MYVKPHVCCDYPTMDKDSYVMKSIEIEWILVFNPILIFWDRRVRVLK